MGKCSYDGCKCQQYRAPNFIEAGLQKLFGGAALGCLNCSHHVNYH